MNAAMLLGISQVIRDICHTELEDHKITGGLHGIKGLKFAYTFAERVARQIGENVRLCYPPDKADLIFRGFSKEEILDLSSAIVEMLDHPDLASVVEFIVASKKANDTNDQRERTK